MTLQLQPISLQDARLFVLEHHRHHKPPLSGFFAVAVNDGIKIVGVAIIGRPVARALQDGWTAEVTRVCTDDTPHVASKLYGAAGRACRDLGYKRLITYTLTTEPGTSLRAAGWKSIYETRDRPKGWDTPSRPRTVKAPTEAKRLFAPPWSIEGTAIKGGMR